MDDGHSITHCYDTEEYFGIFKLYLGISIKKAWLYTAMVAPQYILQRSITRLLLLYTTIGTILDLANNVIKLNKWCNFQILPQDDSIAKL